METGLTLPASLTGSTFKTTGFGFCVIKFVYFVFLIECLNRFLFGRIVEKLKKITWRLVSAMQIMQQP